VSQKSGVREVGNRSQEVRAIRPSILHLLTPEF
jgi:hypothetical protein